LSSDRHLDVFDTEVISAETFETRVTSIREQSGISREQAVKTLEETLQEWADTSEGSWTDAELNRAREIAATKYESDAWNENRTDPLDS
jgi:lipoate-protein ligase A